MKQYFAKYLPVEGEIKEGLPALFTDGVIAIPLQCNVELAKKNGAKVVKLFLCSRDVNLGDDVLDSNFNKHYVSDNYMTNKHQWEGNWFKVIGEISPNAKWVKEGDEFDEIRRPFIDYDGDESYITPKENLENTRCFKAFDYWQVPCPCCGDYK